MPEFDTTAQGCRLATSVGGVLIGRGADLIIIDDPLKPDEALSQTQRRAANEWYDHTLYSRLNDKLAGAIVLIMHRLHEDDLTGHVLAQEAWEAVRLPALAEADESEPIDTVLGPQHFTRRRGEPLHPEREPLAVLEHIRLEAPRDRCHLYDDTCQELKWRSWRKRQRRGRAPFGI
jgi:hypothetical protein